MKLYNILRLHHYTLKIIGTVPFSSTATHDRGVPKFHCTKFGLFYTILLILLSIAGNAYCILLTSFPMSFYGYTFVMLVTLVSTLIRQDVLAKSLNKLIDVDAQLHLFDREAKDISRFTVAIAIMRVVSETASVWLIFSNFNIMSMSVILCIISFTKTMVENQFLGYIYLVKERFQALNKILSNITESSLLTEIIKVRPKNDVLTCLRKLRFLHYDLCEITKAINSCFSWSLLASITLNFLTFTIYGFACATRIYKRLFGGRDYHDEESLLVSFIWICMELCDFTSMAVVCSQVTTEVIFCGTHDMPLRGKQADEGVLLDLLKLRIDSGDNKLKSHFEKCRRNAIYTSPRIQNELINLCGEVIQENVISEVRKTMAYSILADETADVSGKEQLSIGVRFYDESKSKIREEFVGFVELKAQNASAIAEAIDNFLISSNLSKEDCVGFGFDGCSTMAGKEGGVQAILRKKYPRALYFHCSSHKLNLVVNDANAVPEIRNTVATVKDVITFFRESTTRRNYAPNLSRLCETRWSEKYKSIRKFSQHFSELVKSLETLSVEGNYATRKSAYQLHSAVTKPVFIVSLQTIAKYSAVIEPVVNALQAKSIDMISVGKHIKNIKDILRNDREFPDRISNEILQKARAVAMDLNIEISVPRLAHKQTHRSNPPSDNDNEYWRRSLIIPYIDSLISSLNIRFSQENTPAFALSRLHPLYMTKTSIADLHKNAESFQEFYNLDITGELNLWHNLWVTKALSDDQLKDIEVVDLFKEANIFYPAVRKALIILSTIPCTTATVERSFSTLRRVKNTTMILFNIKELVRPLVFTETKIFLNQIIQWNLKITAANFFDIDMRLIYNQHNKDIHNEKLNHALFG
nr:unnamed protein product [Callosobruchus analis]